jgi:peptidoglycan/xylan/chitin deacetylase (PgdA/CDA1 family)
VVTFDDGYADNVETALPLLKQQRIPATVFLTTGAIDARREFWWDELARVLLEAGPLPGMLELRRGDWIYQQALDADAMAGVGVTGHRSWRAWEEPPTVRHRMYYELWQRLYPLAHDRRQALLDDLLEWAGLEPRMRRTHRLVSLAEAQQLAQESLIEIGAHTVTHPPLTTLDPVARDRELQKSKRVLEEMVRREVSSFAYPHGDHNTATVSAVRAAGFTAACTTAAATLSAASALLTLPRYQVLDWSGDELSARLQTWQRAHGVA